VSDADEFVVRVAESIRIKLCDEVEQRVLEKPQAFLTGWPRRADRLLRWLEPWPDGLGSIAHELG
jgi:hypothetical protein